MVVKQLDSEALTGLRSKDRLELLDAIDTLRSQGISHYVSLPQIIVCGDQSSGKSSVLEAISGLSFPVKNSLCTRFPTEIILRQANYVSVKVSIVPDKTRPTAEAEALKDFKEQLDNFQDLPRVIDEAKVAMGIRDLGKRFSRDLLRIEIAGPARPHLTIVDLPGLVHSENKQQTAADVKLIKEVVTEYMRERRSIMLCVISAKNDHANQIVLKLAREADPKGTRTLGIITKPDTLVPGSEYEANFVSLAKNQDIEFRLGWHVLRNTDTDTEKLTLTERDSNESLFFATSSSWRSIPPESRGIEALRKRLSTLLLHQIASELPNLMQEITLKSSACKSALEQLGQPRENLQEQKLYLGEISQSFQYLTQAAVDGTCDDSFFGDVEQVSGYQKRFRAVLQNLNQTFADKLRDCGKQYHEGNVPMHHARTLTREQFITKVANMIEKTRGKELPGMFNPMMVSDLFRKQSTPWTHITESHIEQLWDAAMVFLGHVVEHVADKSTTKGITSKIIVPAMDSIKQHLVVKVKDILAPHREGHPITYNDSFVEALQAIRKSHLYDQHKAMLYEVCGWPVETDPAQQVNKVTASKLLQSLSNAGESDITKQAASDALDCMEAYYKVALERFTDNIAVEAVEACLVSEMLKILRPLDVLKLSDEEISAIAGETEESRDVRKRIQDELNVLSRGADMCQRFSSYRIDDLPDMIDKKDDRDDKSFSSKNERPFETARSPAVESEIAHPEAKPMSAPVQVERTQSIADASVKPQRESEYGFKAQYHTEFEPEPEAEPAASEGDLEWGALSKKDKKKRRAVKLDYEETPSPRLVYVEDS